MSTGGSALGAQDPGETTLSRLRDSARPLLVFAPRADDAQMVAQLRTLAEHASEVKDRDIAVIAMPLRNSAQPSPPLTPVTFSEADAAAARRRFHVTPGAFQVVLIGKDGGEKLRSSHPLSMEKLRDVIDAMPMRKDEMRGR